MRRYIEEVLDYKFTEVKQYVQELNMFTREDLLNEIIKNIQALSTASYVLDNDWIAGVKKRHDENENDFGLMARAIEEKYYILDDAEEHQYNYQCVLNMVDNIDIHNRWTNENY